MSVESKRGRPRSDAIDVAILDAAIGELIELGYSGLSIEAVAAAAGVAKTTVYRRWSDASELTLAALRGLKNEAVPPPAGSVREQLRWLIERMRRKWNEPRYAAVMRRVAADGTANPQIYHDGRARLVEPHFAIMQEVLARGVAEGLIRDDVDLGWVRQILTAPIVAAGLTVTPDIPAALVETTLDIVLRGLAP